MASPPDEIIEGLQLLGVRTWSDFTHLNGTRLESLKKKANHKLVDVSTVSEDKIFNLHNLIMDTDTSGEPEWDNPRWCAQELYSRHVRAIRLNQ